VSAEILYEFTNCGQTGPFGPSQAQCDSTYVGTSLEGQITVNDGIQLWTVPQSGTYTIETWGAEGGYTNSGKGAYMKGDFHLDAGTVLRVLVGQKGQAGPPPHAESGGGGGGTFVVDAADVLLIIAGGGGGCYYDYSQSGLPCAGGGGPGRIEESGGPDGAGGQNGNGGYSTGQYPYGGGGGGFYTDGEAPTASSSPADYARSFLNGGTGGDCHNLGGFGGGGCTTNNGGNVGAGGGGYSGGNSATWTQSGGGGSFNSGINQENIAGANTGHGRVIISIVSAKGLKEGAISELESINDALNEQSQLKLDEVLYYLKESVFGEPGDDENYWIDDRHLYPDNGDDVFSTENDAVEKLMEILEKPDEFGASASVVAEIVRVVEDKILEAQRLLAQTAIDEASSGDPELLAEAAEEMAKAESAKANGEYDKAVENYFKAWEAALKSIGII